MNCEQENRRSPRIAAKWNWLFLSSLVVGVAACSSPYILRGPWADAHGKFIFFGWPTAWMSIVIVTLIRHGRADFG